MLLPELSAAGWSLPMLILSGQVRYDTTARWTGLGIRAMGDQEFDITKAIDCMTKYSEMVVEPMRIRYCLEKALYLAQSGRPGPAWLDIPLNVQGAYVDSDELIGFDPADYEAGGTGWALAEGQAQYGIEEDIAGKGEHRQLLPPKVSKETVRTILEKIRQARPSGIECRKRNPHCWGSSGLFGGCGYAGDSGGNWLEQSGLRSRCTSTVCGKSR